MEFLIVKCRPFYLLRDFSTVIVAVVYTAPSTDAKANTNEALGRLHDAISELLTKHLDSFVEVAGDYNHISLKALFPKFKRVVDFKTRRENMLDRVECSRVLQLSEYHYCRTLLHLVTDSQRFPTTRTLLGW